MLAEPADYDSEDKPLHHQQQQQEQQYFIPPEPPIDPIDPDSPRSNSTTAPKRLRLRLPATQPTHPASQDAYQEPYLTAAQLDMVAPRRSSRISTHSQPSGSEYSAQGGSVSSRSSESQSRRTRSNRVHKQEDDDDFDNFPPEPKMATYVSRGGRQVRLRHSNLIESDDDEDDHPVRPAGTRKLPSRAAASHRRRDSFLDDEDDEPIEDDDPQMHNTRAKSKQRETGERSRSSHGDTKKTDIHPNPDAPPPISSRELRAAKRRSARQVHEENDYVDDGPSHSSIDVDAEGSVEPEDPIPSTPEEPRRRTLTPEETRGYGLRKRTSRVNYALPPPLAPDEIGPHINGNSTGGVNAFVSDGKVKGKGAAHKSFRHVAPWGMGARLGAPGADFGRFPSKALDDSVSYRFWPMYS